MPRILAVVVLYFPAKPAEEIIKGFKREVDDVLIVDNTENNTGVAAALNLGMKKAVQESYDWLLTMDQDSDFEEGGLKALKTIAFNADKSVGMVSPFHKTQKARPATGIEEVRITMTSGCLVRVN